MNQYVVRLAVKTTVANNKHVLRNPKSGSSNAKPTVSVKQASCSTREKWKLDQLEIEVGADKFLER